MNIHRARPVWFVLLWAVCSSAVGSAWTVSVQAQDGHEAEASPRTAGQAAAEPGQEPSDRAQAFVAVEGAAAEDVAGGPLLLGAYALVWLFVLGYVMLLVRRTARTEADVARLAAQLRGRSG